jgi:hypothetical protein
MHCTAAAAGRCRCACAQVSYRRTRASIITCEQSIILSHTILEDRSTIEMEYSDSYHAALLRALPSNNTLALARRDPMRHPDVHSLQRELMSDAAMEQRRESERTTLDNGSQSESG